MTSLLLGAILNFNNIEYEEVQGGYVAKDLTGTYFVELNIEK